jgi:hypothetical protein
MAWDVVVVWDAEDDSSDVYFAAGMMIAKALALRTNTVSKGSPVDVDALDRAIREIERQAGLLEEIRVSSRDNQVQRGEDPCANRTDALTKQIATLEQQAFALREFVGQASARDSAA